MDSSAVTDSQSIAVVLWDMFHWQTPDVCEGDLYPLWTLISWLSAYAIWIMLFASVDLSGE